MADSDFDDLLSELGIADSPTKESSRRPSPRPVILAQTPAQSKSMSQSSDLEAEINGLLDDLDDSAVDDSGGSPQESPPRQPITQHSQPKNPSAPKPVPGGYLEAPSAHKTGTAGNGGERSRCTSVSTGYAEEQGNRPTMEDRCLTKTAFFPSAIASKISSTRAMCAVFDGHSGSSIADYSALRLPEMLQRESWYKEGREPEVDAVKRSLEKVVVQLDDEILQKTVEGNLSGGSTANIALLIDDWLHVANLGDARAVLSRGGQALALSQDHKPDVEAERQRIEASDGRVEWRGCWRVMTQNGGPPRGLAVSRALGDVDWKIPVMLVESVPDVSSTRLTSLDEFVIIACDGLWDVLSNQRAVELVRARLREAHGLDGDAAAKAAAASIAREALALGSEDNVTVVIMKFEWC